jgi:hypothetical protein
MGKLHNMYFHHVIFWAGPAETKFSAGTENILVQFRETPFQTSAKGPAGTENILVQFRETPFLTSAKGPAGTENILVQFRETPFQTSAKGPAILLGSYLMYVWPCIIYENDEKCQLDATIVIYYHKLSLQVSGICMPIFRSTGCMLLHMVFCTRFVAVVPRSWCIVLGTVCEFVSQLLHQVGTSRHFYIWRTVTHTSKNCALRWSFTKNKKSSFLFIGWCMLHYHKQKTNSEFHECTFQLFSSKWWGLPAVHN